MRGWGVFGLPFDSGHVLALRVFPENDFAPYRTVWHRTPDGAWSIFVDAPRLDIACPRYYGAACVATALVRIDVDWVGPMSLHVAMTSPLLDWTVDASETPLLSVLNWISPHLPLWTWKPDWLVHAREVLASSVLGMGTIRMRGLMPSGHAGTLMRTSRSQPEECWRSVKPRGRFLISRSTGEPEVRPNADNAKDLRHRPGCGALGSRSPCASLPPTTLLTVGETPKR